MALLQHLFQPQDVYCQHSSPARRRRNLYRRSKLRVVRLAESVLSNNHVQQRKWCRAAGRKQAPTLSFPMDLGQALAAILDQTGLVFSAFVRENSNCERSAGGRKRDIFPLPLPQIWPETVPCHEGFSSIRLVFLQCCLSALNFLAIDFKANRSQTPRRTATASQTAVIVRIAHRCSVFLERLAAECPPDFDWSSGFTRYELAEKSCGPPLKADAVDIPEQAGTCDPSTLLSDDLLKAVSDVIHFSRGSFFIRCKRPGPGARTEQSTSS